MNQYKLIYNKKRLILSRFNLIEDIVIMISDEMDKMLGYFLFRTNENLNEFINYHTSIWYTYEWLIPEEIPIFDGLVIKSRQYRFACNKARIIQADSPNTLKKIYNLLFKNIPFCNNSKISFIIKNKDIFKK